MVEKATVGGWNRGDLNLDSQAVIRERPGRNGVCETLNTVTLLMLPIQFHPQGTKYSMSLMGVTFSFKLLQVILISYFCVINRVGSH